jgi:transcriptional regulator of met regulon
MLRYKIQRLRDAVSGAILKSSGLIGGARTKFAGHTGEVRSLPEEAQTTASPIYHVHIRKTGGTTVNHCLLSALTGLASEDVYRDLANARHNRLTVDGVCFAGWNKNSIAAGGWDYAFSHRPLEMQPLPADAVLITCFRDPVARLASHYRMLREMIDERSHHPIMGREAPWASGSFRQFVDRVPDSHRLTQLHMFSTALNLAEAETRIARVRHVLWTESLQDGLTELADATGLPLAVDAHRRASRPMEIPASELEYAREALALEYEWLDRVRREIKPSQPDLRRSA